MALVLFKVFILWIKSLKGTQSLIVGNVCAWGLGREELSLTMRTIIRTTKTNAAIVL